MNIMGQDVKQIDTSVYLAIFLDNNLDWKVSRELREWIKKDLLIKESKWIILCMLSLLWQYDGKAALELIKKGNQTD